MTIPEAAIEAAAGAHYEATYPDDKWADATDIQHMYLRDMEVALEAVMPAILTDLREGLGDLLRSEHLPPGVEEHPEGTCEICDWVGCLQDEWLNDRIVRGGTP